ncbi:hypothetical protein [Schleiferilactobacillus perolens]|uniref:hypothetical protein n=1 Tax=Schleiferilactobacillus perolens TaxID=100468 RepID=UPI0023542F70|nr:hypothetical protein [Schleiferilactobacillus perolens]MCI1892540.1 hypothetical protein [Schleiferilactobacillus harbinensis]MCI2171550.1 hypothetical protein [Schleiferilactobacillus perolens]
MKSKSLALANGIIGLVGGIILIFGPILLLGGAVADVGTNSIGTTSAVAVFLNFLKIAILVLGILGILYYRGTNFVKTAPHVLLIVGGGVALIPFLGWAGGIVIIVGGALYLASLKNFKTGQNQS